MNLSSQRLPFYSVLAAAIVPWINGFTGSNVPGYCFDLVLISLAGISLATHQHNRPGMRLPSWLFLILFYAGCFMLFIIHRIHPLSDFLVVVPITLVYVYFLSRPCAPPGELLRQLKWLYFFHIGFIVFELIIYSLDLRFIFQFLSGDRYREFPFHLLSKLVLNIGNGAPNSFLMQTQAASHLVGSAFFLLYLTSTARSGVAARLPLLALFLLFLLLITNTSLLVFALLAIAIWIFRANLTTRVSVLILTLCATWLFLDEILSIILYRVYEGTSLDQILWDDYFYLFTIPISNILNAAPLQLLFGHGIDRAALESGELGFATLVFIGGIYVIGLQWIWLSSILLVGLVRYNRIVATRDLNVGAWRSLLLAGVVLCAAWALSTVHYLIIFIPGGMHLFAFALAVVVTASARLRTPRPVTARDKVRTRPLAVREDLSPG